MKRFLKTIEDVIVEHTGDAALAALLTLRIEEALTPKFVVRVKNQAKDDVRELGEKIMVMWSDIVGHPKKPRRPSDKLLYLISARMNTFSGDDIFNAVYKRAQYISTSPWHDLPENRHHKLDPTKSLRSDEDVLKWLHREVKARKEPEELKKIDVRLDEKLLE